MTTAVLMMGLHDGEQTAKLIKEHPPSRAKFDKSWSIFHVINLGFPNIHSYIIELLTLMMSALSPSEEKKKSNNETNLWMHIVCPSGRASSWTHYRRKYAAFSPRRRDTIRPEQLFILEARWRTGLSWRSKASSCSDYLLSHTMCSDKEEKIQWPLDSYLAADRIMQIALLSKEYGQCLWGFCSFSAGLDSGGFDLMTENQRE